MTISTSNLDVFEILTKQNYKKVYQTVYSHTQDQYISEDAVRLAFIIAYKKLDQLQSKEKFASWVISIALNEASGLLNSKNNAKPTPLTNLHLNILSDSKESNVELKEDLDNNQWQKIKKQLLDVDNSPVIKNPFLKHKRIIVAATIILSVGSSNFIYPNNTNALGGKLAQFFTYVVGKTTQNVTTTYNQPSKQDIPTVVEVGDIIQKEVTLDQAQASVDFKLAIPSYLPPETNIKRVLLAATGTDVYDISIVYIFNDNVIIFKQMYIPRQYSSGRLYDTDDTVVKDLIVNGSPALLFINKYDTSTINWQLRNLILEITGNLTEEEITKIANSIH